MDIKRNLLFVGIWSTWLVLPARSEAQTRPPNMPCSITREVVENSPFVTNGLIWRTEYRLYYRRDGRIGLATRRATSIDCRGNNNLCDELPGSEWIALQYKYDAQGRLVGTQSDSDGEQELLTVSYSGDRASRIVSIGHNKSRTETTVLYDPSGVAIGALAKGKFWMVGPRKSETKSSLSGGREPFRAHPIVWPFNPGTLYLGWVSRWDQVKVEGLTSGTYEESVTFLPDGRIHKNSSKLKGTPHGDWIFGYSCPDEKPAEQVGLELK